MKIDLPSRSSLIRVARRQASRLGALLAVTAILATPDSAAAIRAEGAGSSFQLAWPAAVDADNLTRRLAFVLVCEPPPSAGAEARLRLTSADALLELPLAIPTGVALWPLSVELAPYLGDATEPVPIEIVAPPGCRVADDRVWAIDADLDADPGAALVDADFAAALESTPDLEEVVPAPVAWPAETIGAGGWTASTVQGNAIIDLEGASDPSTGGTTPQSEVDISSAAGTRQSVFFAFDPVGRVLFLRQRVKTEPLTSNAVSSGSGSGSGPFSPSTWNLLLDTDGDGWKEFAIILDGGSGGASGDVNPSGDDLFVYYSNLASQAITPAGVSGGNVVNANHLVWYAAAATRNATVPGQPTGDGAPYDFGRTRRVRHTAANATWGEGFFVDVQLPIDALTTSYFGTVPAVRSDTPLGTGFATANSNTNPLQKDFASSYAFTAGAGVRFPFTDPMTSLGGQGQDPMVGGMNTSASLCPTTILVTTRVIDELPVNAGIVTDSIQSARFDYYVDSNRNGLPDDGNSWLLIPPLGASLNPDTRGDLGPAGTGASFNDWGVLWNNSTAQIRGMVLIRVTVTDDQAHQVVEPLGSYFLSDDLCLLGPTRWDSYTDPDHLLPNDDFYRGDTVYMFGGSLASSTTYQVVYYDSSLHQVASNLVVSGFLGRLASTFAVGPNAAYGDYYSVVYPTSVESSGMSGTIAFGVIPPRILNDVWHPTTNPFVGLDWFQVLRPAPPAAPIVDSPLFSGATTVTGTSTEPPGSIITVYVDGVAVGTTVVRADGTWSLAGIPPLVAGQVVTATTTVGGIEGPPSAPVTVVMSPVDVTATPVVDAPLYTGDTTVSGTVAAPDGTVVDVYVNGAYVGSATVTGGGWVLTGIPPLAAGDVITAVATAPGLGTSPPSLPVVVTPNTPVVDSPIFDGATLVTGTSEEPPGSVVTVYVNSVAVGTAVVLADGTWVLDGIGTLAAGDVVTATINVGGIDSAESPPVVVGLAGAITPPPTVNSPVFAGDTEIAGTSTAADGTAIDVYIDGVYVGSTTVMGGTWTLPVDPLMAGQVITAVATEPGLGTSESSAPVTVASGPGNLTLQPVIDAPIYTGSTTVSGTSTEPDGTVIDVFVDGVHIGSTVVGGGVWVLTDIDPALVAGEVITATATTDGKGTSAPSAPVVVEPWPPVVTSPIMAGATAVSGTSVEPPGTVITAYVDGVAVGTTMVDTMGGWTLSGIGPLAAGQVVTATATSGGIDSAPSAPVVVSTLPVPAPVVDAPRVEGDTTVTGTSSLPDGSLIHVYVDGVLVGDTVVMGGVWQLDSVGPLLAGQVVTAIATDPAGGTSPPAAPVVVLPPPPVVTGPLFTGATTVSGTSSLPDGSVIDVYVGGVLVGSTVVGGATWTLAGLGPLTAGQTVTATAILAGVGTSPASAPVIVLPTPPVVDSPIVDGATQVSGTSIEPPGTIITVYVDGVAVGTTMVDATGSWTLPGVGPLTAGQVVTATATVGGIEGPPSAPVIVSLPAQVSPAPAVDDPIYEGATVITGTSPAPDGTVIDVYVDGVLVGSTTVSAGTWTLSDVAPLAAGQVITATATEPGAGTSPPSPPVIVAPLPPTVDSPIADGATQVSGTAMQPAGTVITVYVDGVVVGTTVVDATGSWTLTGIGPLVAGQVVTASATVAGIDSPPSYPVVVSPPAGSTPPPAVDAPLSSSATTITGTSPSPAGTTIDVFVDGVLIGSTTVAADGTWVLDGVDPLAAGQEITATATEPGLGTSAPSTPVTVLPLPPLVDTPIIAGGTQVSGTSVEPPGSVITVHVDGVAVGTTIVGADGTWVLTGVGPLMSGQVITATVTVAGIDSPPSAPVVVGAAPTPPPQVDAPLFTGAEVISGTSTAPDGTLIDVFVDGVLVGSTTVSGGRWTLSDVAPLNAGQQVTATATTPGSGTSGPSNRVVVQPNPPSVDAPLLEGDTSVSGWSTEAPGSIITVFVDGIPVGSTTVQPDGSFRLDNITPPLVAGQVVTARVTAGGETSGPSNPVIVGTLTPPAPPVVNSPIYTGATTVSGTSTAPDGTRIDVFVDGIFVGQTTVHNGQWVLTGAGPLAAGQVVTATATTLGMGTSAPSAPVVVQPNPPVVDSPITAGATSVSGTSSEAPGSVITVYVDGVAVGTTVVQPDGTWVLTGVGPLVAGQVVTAAVNAGGIDSAPSNPVVVSGPAGPTPPPTVDPGLRTGATTITGTSTSPDGSIIDVYVDGVLVGQTTVMGGVWTLSGVGPLASGQVVTATATETGRGTSTASNPVVVQPWPPVVSGPLLEGMTAVSGRSVEAPGSIITVYVDGVAVGTAVVQADGSWTAVGLPVLVAGQVVTATVTAGGIVSGPSPPVVVGLLAVTPPPAVTGPIDTGATTITGTSTSPAGTRIDVYVDGIFVGTTTVDAMGGWVLTGVGPLVAGQQVWATATEPGLATSGLSNVVVVGGVPSMLRNDEVVLLSPMRPRRDEIFTPLYGGDPFLDPLGSSPTGIEGEGGRTTLNGSDDDDDLYVRQVADGWIDPDADVRTDNLRPLVFYQLADGGINNLFLVRSGNSVQARYTPR